jgi:hypothetical protein
LFTGVTDTGDKFITSAVVTGDNCSLVSMTPVNKKKQKFIIVVVVTGDHCSEVPTTLVINLSENP